MNNRKRKKLRFPSHQFVDGKGSYAKEYLRWRKPEFLRSVVGVKGLLGVHEIPIGEFSQEPDVLLALVGHGGLAVIEYDPDEPTGVYYEPSSDEARVTGYTCAVRTPYGKVKSIVFLREVIFPPELTDPEIRAINKLGLLIHEVSHAEDIDRSVNYDHQTPSFDAVAAEVYAHTFVLRRAQRLGYKQLLYSYCLDLENDLCSVNEVYREAAERVSCDFDIPAIKKATGFR